MQIVHDPMKRGQMDRFNKAHIVERHVHSFLSDLAKLTAGKTGTAKSNQTMTIRPFRCANDIRAVAGTADRDQQIARVGEVFQLLGEDTIESLVVGPGEDVRRVVGETHNAEALFAVVVKVLPAKRAFTEVFAKM